MKRIATVRAGERASFMIDREEHVVAIVAAADCRLVSRVRMQKIAYLLDQIGMDSGFDYQYHHYGPYSRDLDNAILDAEAFGMVEETFERRQSDGARYSVFTCKTMTPSDAFGHLGADEARKWVKRFAATNVTVLELAATAHWISFFEEVADWQSEIVRRKGPKTEGGRLQKALELLADLKLVPAVSNAA
jgi:uncharacterized protein